MRTIIDGSTADIRKSPDWIVLSMQAGDGVIKKPFVGLWPNPSQSNLLISCDNKQTSPRQGY
jgi:hypothetical protein